MNKEQKVQTKESKYNNLPQAIDSRNGRGHNSCHTPDHKDCWEQQVQIRDSKYYNLPKTINSKYYNLPQAIASRNSNLHKTT